MTSPDSPWIALAVFYGTGALLVAGFFAACWWNSRKP